MSNPLKDIQELLSVPKSIKIGTIVSSKNGRSSVRTSDGTIINAWGVYPRFSNVYVKDNVILGLIKKSNVTEIYID